MSELDYWIRVRVRAAELGGDHCTWVPDFYSDCCDEHDIAYRTGRTVDGAPRSQQQADLDLRH